MTCHGIPPARSSSPGPLEKRLPCQHSRGHAHEIRSNVDGRVRSHVGKCMQDMGQRQLRHRNLRRSAILPVRPGLLGRRAQRSNPLGVSSTVELPWRRAPQQGSTLANSALYSTAAAQHTSDSGIWVTTDCTVADDLLRQWTVRAHKTPATFSFFHLCFPSWFSSLRYISFRL